MSKEEILEGKEVEHWDWLRMKGTTPTVYRAVTEAMEQYAKQESIAFAEWIMENDWVWELDELVGFMWYQKDASSSPMYNSSQLFTLYSSHKEKL